MSGRWWRWVWLVGIVALPGCHGKTVIVVNEPPSHPPPRAEVVYVDDTVTIAEIDAVRDLTFDSGRQAHLSRIARRHNLGPDAQVHLVKTALDVLTFDSSQKSVLLDLAKNPTLCAQTKAFMLDQLDRLTFDSSRQSILRALSKNPALRRHAHEPPPPPHGHLGDSHPPAHAAE